jgi:hypothetical protein
MDGYTFVAAVRAAGPNRGTRIVMVSTETAAAEMLAATLLGRTCT